MNDIQIRLNFHEKKLRWQHADETTLVIDELGLNHGRCRADIAVVNGHLIGYEIKSDSDTLNRLEEQVKSYNAVFDKAFVIVGQRYAEVIMEHIPEWWGIILSEKGSRGAIHFTGLRKAARNDGINPIFLARLLWRDEVAEVLRERGLPPRCLRQPRARLYEYLVSILDLQELRRIVRDRLKMRKNWRYPESPS